MPKDSIQKADQTDAEALREEPAAILEYEAGMNREEAERRAGLLNALSEGPQNVQKAGNIAHLANSA